MSDKSSVVAVMGGTFDPVHNGHLRSALELKQKLALDEVHLVPCHQTTHRQQPGRTSQQRLEMLQLAVSGEESLCIDDRELCRDQASYSVLTLQSLRDELGESAVICWVLGVDAFAHFTRWHQWQRILELANLVVITRPGFELDPQSEEARLWRDLNTNPEMLSAHRYGRIVPVRLPTQLEISATYIRQQLADNQSVRYLLPESVLAYIEKHGLYRTSSD